MCEWKTARLQQKTQLRDEITELIKDTNQIGRGFQIKDRYIIYKKKQVTAGLSQSYIANSLYKFFGNKHEAQELFSYLMDNRPLTEKYQLEMVKRQKKSKDQSQN